MLRYIEANNTAYLVMDYLQGQTLGKYLKTQGPALPEEEIWGIFLPILDGLCRVHAAGMLHRDIKPDNIYLPDDAEPLLLDFGAARYALGEKSRSLSVILTPGYAPFEQYRSRGKQGAWTDIYGIGASMYRCMSGHAPPEAPDRSATEEPGPYVPAAEATRNGYSTPLLRGVDAALAFSTHQRPQTARAFQKMLTCANGPVAPEIDQNEAVHEDKREAINDSRPVEPAQPASKEEFATEMVNPTTPWPWKSIAGWLLVALVVAGVGLAVWKAEQGRGGPADNEKELAGAQRRFRDNQAFLAAKEKNNIAAFETYLANCSPACNHAGEAQRAIQHLEKLEAQQRQRTKTAVNLIPSFDCRKASTYVEREICRNPDLAELDAALGQAYRSKRSILPKSAVDRLRQEQLAWLRKRDGYLANSCSWSGNIDSACARPFLEKRIGEIERWAE